MGLILGLIILFLSANPALAKPAAGDSAVLQKEVLGYYLPDMRVEKLAYFLESYDSPLEPYADFFIQMADKYQIDWRLVPAITGVESTFGKQIPRNSYNAYGWANGAFQFKSWEESIEKVSQALKKNYYERGLTTPYKIAPVYAPPSKTWAGKVVFFMNKLENFAPATICLTL